MLENVLIGVILWVVGLFFGFVIRGAFFKSSEAEIKLRQKFEEVQQEFADYQARVRAQMLKTADILKDIQKGCEAAETQVLLAAQDLNGQGGRAPGEIASPPKDYPSHS